MYLDCDAMKSCGVLHQGRLTRCGDSRQAACPSFKLLHRGPSHRDNLSQEWNGRHAPEDPGGFLP